MSHVFSDMFAAFIFTIMIFAVIIIAVICKVEIKIKDEKQDMHKKYIKEFYEIDTKILERYEKTQKQKLEHLREVLDKEGYPEIKAALTPLLQDYESLMELLKVDAMFLKLLL